MRGKSLCSLCQIILGRVSNVTTSIFVEKCQVSLQNYDMRWIAAHVPCMQLLPKTATWMISRATHVSNNSLDKRKIWNVFVWPNSNGYKGKLIVLQTWAKKICLDYKDYKGQKWPQLLLGKLSFKTFQKSHGQTQNITIFTGMHIQI